MPARRILVVADVVHPYIYSDAFPNGLGQIDLVLGAGDLPGYYLEFLATRVPAPVVYVHGNHGEEKVKDYLGNMSPPGGVIDAHGKVLRAGGVIIAGWGGAPKYRERGEGQYTGPEVRWGLQRMAPKLGLNRARYGRALDVFLTHAPPPGPHAGQDHAHRPCKYIGAFDERYRPPLHVHGHVHNYDGRKVEYLAENGVRVVNAYGYLMLDLEVPSLVPTSKRR